MEDEFEALQEELKKKYAAAKEEVEDLIYAKVKEADEALTKAVKISEKHGVCFDSSVSFLGQCYVPESFSEKFGKLENPEEITKVYGEYLDYSYGGWEHSDVC